MFISTFRPYGTQDMDLIAFYRHSVPTGLDFCVVYVSIDIPSLPNQGIKESRNQRYECLMAFPGTRE